MKKALFWTTISVVTTCLIATLFLGEESKMYWFGGAFIIFFMWLVKIVVDHYDKIEKERLWHRAKEWYKSAEKRMTSSYTSLPLSPDNLKEILHLEGKLFPTIDSENNHTYIIKLGGGYSVKFTLRPRYGSDANMSTYSKQFSEMYLCGWSLKQIILFHERKRIQVA